MYSPFQYQKIAIMSENIEWHRPLTAEESILYETNKEGCCFISYVMRVSTPRPLTQEDGVKVFTSLFRFVLSHLENCVYFLLYFFDEKSQNIHVHKKNQNIRSIYHRHVYTQIIEHKFSYWVSGQTALIKVKPIHTFSLRYLFGFNGLLYENKK